MKIRTTAIAALLSVAAVTAAGCGGSSSDQLSQSDLVAKANAICKQVVADIGAATDAQDWDKVRTVGEDGVSKLKDLTPPDDLKDKYDAYLAAQTASLAATEPIIAALKAGDQAKAKSLATAAGTANAKADAAATAAGLTECAKDS